MHGLSIGCLYLLFGIKIVIELKELTALLWECRRLHCIYKTNDREIPFKDVGNGQDEL